MSDGIPAPAQSSHRDVNAALVVLHWGMQHVLSVLLAWLWLHNNRSQELAVYHGYRIPARPVEVS